MLKRLALVALIQACSEYRTGSPDVLQGATDEPNAALLMDSAPLDRLEEPSKDGAAAQIDVTADIPPDVASNDECVALLDASAELVAWCRGTAADLASDPEHCGRCFGSCYGPSVLGATCSMGACRVTSCAAGRGDCDEDPNNGCETSTRFDLLNCGRCGHRCARECRDGTCR